MFDTSERQTQAALLELRDLRHAGKNVVLWLGAGVSRWAGYPLWNELAQQLHSNFLRTEPNYEEERAARALEVDLPLLFSLCRKINSGKFYDILAANLLIRNEEPVYRRLIQQLSDISPLSIITTNVDERLERSLSAVEVYQRSSIELAQKALSQSRSFILKIHGTSSAIGESTWTTEDYDQLRGNANFLHNLSSLIAGCTVIFLGYSLRDDYVVRMLTTQQEDKKLIGDGPHFLISADTSTVQLPPQIRVIRYLVHPHVDHRAALLALDQLTEPPQAVIPQAQGEALSESSIYFPDYISYGTWNTSQQFEMADITGKTVGRGIVGTGFVQEEFTGVNFTGLHDLVVGLIAFETIYFPIHGVSQLYKDVGEESFMLLLKSNALRFVWRESDFAVVFGEQRFRDGALAMLGVRSQDKADEPRTLHEILCNQFSTKNQAFIFSLETLLDGLIIKFGDDELKHYPVLAQGSLVDPRLRKLLGMSDAILPSKIPEWHAFSALRVATVTQDAQIATRLGAGASKIAFGVDDLVNATFGLVKPRFPVSEQASYVIAGSFNADLGEVIRKNPAMLQKIINFRESVDACNLREEIRQLLNNNEGTSFVSAVDAGLKSAVSFSILQQARDGFSRVHMADGQIPVLSAAPPLSDPFKPWRVRSARMLKEYCFVNKIQPYDRCPCGSGDKLKFCCGQLFGNLNT